MAAARWASAAVVFAAAALIAASAEACSSGAGSAESGGDGGDTEAGAESSTVDAAPEARAPRARCALDGDCRAPNGCYTPHCDAVLGVCTYALCEPKGRTCAQGRCDAATFTCSAAKDYSLRTTSYPVGDATLGCAVAGRCFAAIYPFVFIGTKDDVIVLRTDDLLGTVPSTVVRSGPVIKPAHVVASGRRVWIVGDVQGAAAPRQLALSWSDVPSDPNVPRIDAQSVTVSWPYPDVVAFPAPDGAIFLAYNDATEGLPAVRLAPPLAGSPTVAVATPGDAGPPSPAPSHPMFRVVAPAGSTLVASSGSRLLAYRFSSTLNLITAPATATAAVQADLAIQPALPAVVAPRFAQGPDGVVLAAGPVVADPPLPNCNCTTDERITWLLPNAIATTSDVNQASDVEAFTNPQAGACHQCVGGYPTLPSLPVWIDAKTALIASPGSGNDRTLTAVRVVGRDPVTVSGARRFITAATDLPPGDFAIDRIALASSNGFGYLLIADALGANVNLSLIDPRCDAK